MKSTYFVLVNSDFYNIRSLQSRKSLLRIISLGHEIGLHFDETCYSDTSMEAIRYNIIQESSFLSEIIESKVAVVSMHRPSKSILDANIEIPEIVNSYSNRFFMEFKYLSDSRMRWREPVEEIIASQTFDRLHILTHAFWYSQDNVIGNMHDVLLKYINNAMLERYNFLDDNFTDLQSVITIEELMR